MAVNNNSGETPPPSLYPLRPYEEMAVLRQALSGVGTEQCFYSNEEIYAARENDKSLYLFTDGYFSFIRVSDGLVLSSARGEMIYGIAECMRPRGGWFLKIEEPCKARVVPVDQAFEIFTQQNLWQTVASLLTWFIQVYSVREEHLLGVTAYVMIRNKLLELNILTPELRSAINVTDYIQERTQLARSTIMAILSQLRRGEYIEIKRGKLISIKYLPKDY